MSLQPGEVFAGYTIVRELGAGGMGQVYLAVHPRLPRQVALKLLRSDLGSDPAFVGRFQREAATVAALDHPNIVPVDDRGSENGQLWLTMPYIDGTTAEAALADYRPAGMPPERAVHIVSRVASALEYAHRHQLVHRDVKPANILLARPDEEGEPERVFLTDFGVVKGLGEYAGEATSYTTTGSVVATLDYASPEQIEGKPLDGRTDVYALGCVLYKLLTGAIPFPGDTLASKIYAHLHHAPPRPSERVPSLPAAFDQVVAVALAARPEDRFQTPRALADAARSALRAGAAGDATQSLGGRTVTQNIRGDATQRNPLALGPQGGFVSRTPPGGFVPPPTRAMPAPPIPAAQYPQSGPISAQPDYRAVGPPPSPPVTPALSALMQPPQPAPPPNRRRQAILITAVVVVIAAVAATVILLSDKLFGSTASGSSGTGQHGSTGKPTTVPTVSTSEPQIPPVSRSGGSSADTTTSPSTSTSPSEDPAKAALLAKLPRAAKPLPDNTLLVSRLDPDATHATLSPIDTDTGAVGRSILPLGSGRNVTMVGDRRTVIYNEGGKIMAAGTDGADPTVIIDSTKVGCAPFPRPAWNPADPTQLVVVCWAADGSSSLLKVLVDGTVAERITEGLPKHVDDITFKPDGTAVAFWGSDNLKAGSGPIYTLSLNPGATAVQVPDTDGAADPAWSPPPDDNRIVFTQSGKLAIVNLQDGKVQSLSDLPGYNTGPCWSPDGQQLAYRSDPAAGDATGREVWVANADGTAPRELGEDTHPGLAGGPTWALR